MKFQARLRLNAEEQTVEGLECWVHELVPAPQTDKRPGVEWIDEYIRNSFYNQVCDLLGLPPDKSVQVLFSGAIHGSGPDHNGEYDEIVDIDEDVQTAAIDIAAEHKYYAELNTFNAMLVLDHSHHPAQSAYQARVDNWIIRCFGDEMRKDIKERSFRLFEEVAELVQSVEMSKADCLALLDYVHARPAGDPRQEIGGVMTTLAAFCTALDVNMETCGETELIRIDGLIDKIRAKNATKPQRSGPLPGAYPAE